MHGSGRRCPPPRGGGGILRRQGARRGLAIVGMARLQRGTRQRAAPVSAIESSLIGRHQKRHQNEKYCANVKRQSRSAGSTPHDLRDKVIRGIITEGAIKMNAYQANHSGDRKSR